MLKEKVRAEMVLALKENNKARKSALANLLNHLTMAEKEKRSELTSDEENTVVLKVAKQINETIESCPADRTDIRESAQFELNVVNEFAPKMMNEDEIELVINSVLAELGISTPTAKDKGQIMKILMPKVKGKADGKLVNTLLTKKFVVVK